MIEPLNEYVLLEIEPETDKTAGGLYVPQGSNASAIDILKKGKVLAIGPKVHESVKVGKLAYYNKHAITKLPNDETHILVREPDLYGLE